MSYEQKEKVPIPGYPNYTISKDGKVWNKDREKSLILMKTGYLAVSLWNNNHGKLCTLHRLILEVFSGPCPEGSECRHLNGNRLDNRLENLKWGTRSENVSDAISHGTAAVGTKNLEAALTVSDLEFIKDMTLKKVSPVKIASYLGVSYETVRRALKGDTYRRDRVLNCFYV